MVGDQVSEPGSGAHTSSSRAQAESSCLYQNGSRMKRDGAAVRWTVSGVLATKKAHVTTRPKPWRGRRACARDYQKGSREAALQPPVPNATAAAGFPNLLTHPGRCTYKPVVRAGVIGRSRLVAIRRRAGLSRTMNRSVWPCCNARVSGFVRHLRRPQPMTRFPYPLTCLPSVPHLRSHKSSRAFPKALTTVPTKAHLFGSKCLSAKGNPGGKGIEGLEGA